MDKLIELMKLPPWLIPPLAVAALFFLAWPSLRDVWQAIVPSARAYSFEKRRLELLKLRLEVEALREKLPNLPVDMPAPKEVTPSPSQDQPVSVGSRALYGTLGAICASIVPVLFQDLPLLIENLSLLSIGNLIGFGLRIVLLCLIGSVVAISTQVTRRKDAMIYGGVGPLLVQLAISSLSATRPATRLSWVIQAAGIS